MVVSICYNTTPVYTSILGYYMLKEKVTHYEVLSMIGCFMGVLILSLMSNDTSNQQKGLKEGYNTAFGMMCCVISALLESFWIVLTRRHRNIHSSILLFQTGLWSTLIFLVWSLVDFALDQER